MSGRGFAADLWLFIVRNGRTDVEEIRAEFDVAEYSATLRSRMKHMIETKSVVKFPDGTFGVTQQCRIPNGLELHEVLNAINSKGKI